MFEKAIENYYSMFKHTQYIFLVLPLGDNAPKDKPYTKKKTKLQAQAIPF